MKTGLCKLYLRLTEKKAQAMSEYALILSLVAVVTVLVVTTLGTTIRTAFQSIIDSF